MAQYTLFCVSFLLYKWIIHQLLHTFSVENMLPFLPATNKKQDKQTEQECIFNIVKCPLTGTINSYKIWKIWDFWEDQKICFCSFRISKLDYMMLTFSLLSICYCWSRYVGRIYGNDLYRCDRILAFLEF